MKKFPLLTISRQSTEYSCGAAALQAVLRYWGKDLDENEPLGWIGKKGLYETIHDRITQQGQQEEPVHSPHLLLSLCRESAHLPRRL